MKCHFGGPQEGRSLLCIVELQALTDDLSQTHNQNPATECILLNSTAL